MFNFFFKFLFKILPVEQHRKVKYISVIYILSVCFVLFFHIQFNYKYNVYTYNWILLPIYLLMIFTPLIARITKNYEITAFNLLLTASLQTIVLIYAAGGIQAPGIFWLSIFPVAGGILLGKRGIAAGAILITMATTFYFVSANYWITPNLVRDFGNYERQKIINFIAFYIFSTWVTLYFVNKESKAQEEILRHKNEIESLLHILIHDVANPLTVQDMEIYKIKQKNLAPDLQKSIDRIERSTNRVISLLKQIKEMKALKDGKINFVKKPINFKNAYLEAIESLSSRLEEKQIELLSYCRVDNCYILGDDTLLQSVVLNNLIVNAIKFSAIKGKIIINVSDDVKFVYFEIQDYGIGMPEHILKNIFNLAYPTSRTGTSGEKGTGYGMPLVKEYVEKMNGHIAVSSTESSAESSAEIKCDMKPSGTLITLSFAKVNNTVSHHDAS